MSTTVKRLSSLVALGELYGLLQELNDEIKRLNPPYNIVLKRGRRHLLFYNHDFSKASAEQTGEFHNGPFRNSNWIEHLRLLFRSLHQPEFEQIFFNPIPPEDAREGFKLLCALHGMD